MASFVDLREFLPPFYRKLGLMKNFVKGMNKEADNNTFRYLKQKFSRITDAIIKEGIFVDPQIKYVI